MSKRIEAHTRNIEALAGATSGALDAYAYGVEDERVRWAEDNSLSGTAPHAGVVPANRALGAIHLAAYEIAHGGTSAGWRAEAVEVFVRVLEFYAKAAHAKGARE